MVPFLLPKDYNRVMQDGNCVQDCRRREEELEKQELRQGAMAIKRNGVFGNTLH